MQSKSNVLTTLIRLAACAALALGVMARAEDKQAEAKKADPSGTWTWIMPGRNGGPDRTNMLTLKVDGDKLTGNVSSPGRDGQNRESTVEAGKVTGDEVSFTVTREFNGNKMTSKYSGKLTGDTLKGKIEFDRNGETQTRDWEAKRQANKPEAPEKK